MSPVITGQAGEKTEAIILNIDQDLDSILDAKTESDSVKIYQHDDFLLDSPGYARDSWNK